MNETTKHTPGPWKAVRNSSYWEIEPANAGQDGIPFNVGDVCASAPGDPDSGLQEANARLIAAAPELLGALQDLHRECVVAAKRAGTVWPLYGSAKALDEKCRAAIAKAEGKRKPSRSRGRFPLA